jgi:aryl-alcohol dehydrogenase-like predicted oxidoreductase/enamine deaminase RidA (YjgF/YER057c/UK114 family)
MNQSLDRTQLSPDFSISRVLTGLWQVADMERGGETLDVNSAADAMVPYVEAGFTTFDMADHYGSAEEIVGAYRQRHDPDSVQLLTKWVPTPGALTREDVRSAVQRSLDRMKMERLDILQFHAWVYSDPSWLDGLYWLQELREEGLIRHLGLTNVDTAHLRIVETSGIDVVSNQVSYSMLDRRASKGMSARCQESGTSILAFGTVAGGLLTEKWLGKSEPVIDDLDTWSQMKYGRFVQATGGWDRFQGLLGIIKSVADRRETSMANVACRYILDDPAVGGIIIGARLGENDHRDDNLALFSLSFSDHDRAEIDAAVEELDDVPGDCGDEYRKAPFLTASGDLSHHVQSFPAPYPVIAGTDNRSRALSGTIWEDLAGFSRAIRVGDRILVSGTTATHGDLVIGAGDPAAQMHFIIDKIEGAINSLGGTINDVVRTRIYVKDAADWEPISRAHGERFAGIQPANTLVNAGLIGDGYLVEMEAEAVV